MVLIFRSDSHPTVSPVWRFAAKTQGDVNGGGFTDGDLYTIDESHDAEWRERRLRRLLLVEVLRIPRCSPLSLFTPDHSLPWRPPKLPITPFTYGARIEPDLELGIPAKVKSPYNTSLELQDGDILLSVDGKNSRRVFRLRRLFVGSRCIKSFCGVLEKRICRTKNDRGGASGWKC